MEGDAATRRTLLQSMRIKAAANELRTEPGGGIDTLWVELTQRIDQTFQRLAQGSEGLSRHTVGLQVRPAAALSDQSGSMQR